MELIAQLEEAEKAAEEAVGWLSGNLTACIVAAVAVVAVYILWKVLAAGKKELPKPAPDLTIDVMSLGSLGPPEGAPVLEFYNVPVRLAAVVLAPAGRIRQLPPIDQLGDVLDAIVPGLARVVATHKPLVRKWPAQGSAKGFAHTFFGHVRLPGEGGKGTPWSSAAGLMKIEGQPLMAGLLLRTESTSSHGQQIVEAEEKWLAMLRVKGA